MADAARDTTVFDVKLGESRVVEVALRDKLVDDLLAVFFCVFAMEIGAGFGDRTRASEEPFQGLLI